MADKFVICVTQTQASAARWQRGRLLGARVFANTPEDLQAFSTYLRGVRGALAHVAVDTVEEDYRFETLPRARGRDRAELVSRKLRQIYRTTRFHAALLQEKNMGPRGDERYLFSALTNTAFLDPWLDALNAAGLPLVGVYTPPMLSLDVLQKLALDQPNILVVTKNAAGLRQTFFKNGRLRISRLTPLREGVIYAADNYAEEISNTRMYLDALTVTHLNDLLQVVIVDHDDSLAGLAERIGSGRPNMSCRLVPRDEMRTRLGVNVDDLARIPDALQLHLLGSQATPMNLAPAALLSRYRLHKVGRGIYWACAGLVLLTGAWSGAYAWQASRMAADTTRNELLTTQYRAKYQDVTRQFPDAPTTADNLRLAVDVAGRIRNGVRTPESTLRVLSAELEKSPEVFMLRLDWQYDKTPVASGTESRGASGTNAISGAFQSALVDAEIRPFTGDYREALAAINLFAKRLAANPQVAEVKLMKLPVNVDSSATLHGSASNTTASANQGAQFQVLLQLKPGA